MNATEAIKVSMNTPNMIVESYLGDLTDEDLLVRPVDGANHIAWQLGHLIAAENGMIEGICPGSMPALPEGFKDKYNNDTCGSDNADDFLSKDEYLNLAKEQRTATLAALEKLSDEDLEKPSPEEMQKMFPTVGVIFMMQPTHWIMHAGQWAIIRRKLGKPPLF